MAARKSWVWAGMAGAGALAFAGAAGSATVVDTGGIVVANAHADATPVFGQLQNDDHQGVDAVLGHLGGPLTAHAEAHVNLAPASGNDSETVGLAISDPRHGTITFSGQTDATATEVWAAGEAYASPDYAYYSFSADTAVRIDFQYDFEFNGHSFFTPHSIDLYDLSTGTFVNLLPVSAVGASSGSFLAPAGDYYFEVIDAYSDRIFTSGVGGVTGFTSDRLDFSIASVPEPATWTLALAGFLAVGASLRYRRAMAG